MADGINTFNENPLHKALKEWAAGLSVAIPSLFSYYIFTQIIGRAAT